MDKFFFMKDDDGHWYLVPVAERRDFSKWVEAEDGEFFNENYDHFDDMRCEHPSNYEVIIAATR